MKTIFSFFLIAFAATALQAQPIDINKAPQPGPAPIINIADPASFELPNGLKVFVVKNTKLPQVSATLTIDRDPILEGDKAGVLEMAGMLMRRGTTKMVKATLDENVDFLGAELSTSASSVSASSLKNNFPALMKLMADVVLNPAYDAAELEKVRTQVLSGLAQAKDDPNTIVSNVSGMLVYGKDHPYGEVETEETVKNVTVADIKQYYSTYWKPNIAYLILVGDIEPAEAKKLATDLFGSWAKGEVPKKQYPQVAPPAKTFIAVVDRPSSVQSVINISSPIVLKPGTPNAIPASVMGNILGGGFSSRLMQNLREKHGFTYGARGGVSSDKLVGSFNASASVRNEKTDSSIGQFLYEFKRIRDERTSDSEAVSLKNYMSGRFARSLEDPATVASFALNVARYHLPKDYYRNYLSNLNKVSVADIQKMANEYVPVNNLVITIVGNAKEIAKGLEAYGEVKYFDINGNPVAAPVQKAVSNDVTAADVLQKAIAAYGGEAALANVKDITLQGSVEIMGQKMDYVQKHIPPTGFSASVKMGGMELMKQMKNGTNYSVVMQGQSTEVDADGKSELDAKAGLFEEQYYLNNDAYKKEVKGMETIDGAEAYKIQLTSPGGAVSYMYFDTKTGLKLQETRQQDMGQMGTIQVVTRLKDYQEHGGIKVPMIMDIDMSVMKQTISITEVKVNQGLKPTDL